MDAEGVEGRAYVDCMIEERIELVRSAQSCAKLGLERLARPLEIRSAKVVPETFHNKLVFQWKVFLNQRKRLASLNSCRWLTDLFAHNQPDSNDGNSHDTEYNA
eukprot:IDg9996t1